LHALNAGTGAPLWTFEAGAGFHTNPVVIDNAVYAGNRDGFMYALAAGDGRLLWRFETGGPILFSAAYEDGVLYFASNDGHAYALNAADGSPVWRSKQLPGMGFHSFWPVLYQNTVILAGSTAFDGPMHSSERDEIFPNWQTDPEGALAGAIGSEPGDWVAGTPTLDAGRANEVGSTTPITEYLASKPWRRTFFVLDRSTGQEVTFDFKGDGNSSFVPALWAGTTGSGNRYPPVVGNDGALYFRNTYLSDGAISGGGITGWQMGTPMLSMPQARERGGNGNWPVDEPSAYSVGGNYLYHNLCCDRVVGAFDLSQPNPAPPTERVSAGPENPRQWRYRSWQLPGYNSQLLPYLWFPHQDEADAYLYFAHGDQNAPVPYNGMVYVHRSNAVIAFAPAGEGELLPVARTVQSETKAEPRSASELQALLAAEVQKMAAAGRLRPGYSNVGLHNHLLKQIDPFVLDYFHNPADTIVVLLRALPFLPPDLQAETRAYIQAEFSERPPHEIRHVGWLAGAARDSFELPELRRGSWSGPQRGLEPHTFYALWQYAREFGGAPELFESVRNRLPAPPPDAELAWKPHRHNAFIAGYLGYLELEKLTGYPETHAIRDELERLLALRATTFTADLQHPEPHSPTGKYYYTLLISWNFMHLTPELGSYLHDHAFDDVARAVAQYEQQAPYWFVARAEEMQGEGVWAPLHHYHGLFQARARILGQPYAEVAPYLDVPAFTVGDLFYIDNLAAALEAAAVEGELAEAATAATAAPAQPASSGDQREQPTALQADPRPTLPATLPEAVTPAGQLFWQWFVPPLFLLVAAALLWRVKQAAAWRRRR
jgi:hypothetical protein